MRSAPSERRSRWTVGAVAALLGVAVGMTVPNAESTAAAYVDSAGVGADFAVRPCSDAWSTGVAALTPTVHLDFGSSSALPGDVPAPGLLVCDPSGALSMGGGLEEYHAAPTAIPTSAASTVAVWASLTDTTSGELLWLTQTDGYGLGLRVESGDLQVVQVPSGGGSAVTLLQTTAPDSDPHLIVLTRTGSTVQLWVDTTSAGSAALSGSDLDLWLFLGAPPGSGRSAATAVLDELLVLPATLGPGGVAGLVAANTW